MLALIDGGPLSRPISFYFLESKCGTLDVAFRAGAALHRSPPGQISSAH